MCVCVSKKVEVNAHRVVLLRILVIVAALKWNRFNRNDNSIYMCMCQKVEVNTPSCSY